MTKKHNFCIDSFCPEAWSQLEIDAQGDFKICCLANFDSDFGIAVDKNGKAMNVMTHTIHEAINSETHKSHRLEMAKNIKPRRCRNCFDSEEATKGLPEWKEKSRFGVSKRQRVLHRTVKSIPEYVNLKTVDSITNLDGSITNPKVVNLDLRFGNLCNQKCIMCSPQHSNQWYEDWVAIGYGDPEYNRDKEQYKKGSIKEYPIFKDNRGKFQMKGMKKWWESEQWWRTFEEISPDLRHIYFTGGEPLVVPQMQECLDKLISKGFAKNIELRYDTNLTVINQKVIDKWKNFKNVNLCISVDDTWDRYNLIRFPGNFEKIHNNIKWLKENGIEIHYISTCIGLSSLYSVIRISNYATEHRLTTNFRFLEGPNWIDIRNLPKDAKIEIINNLNNHKGDENYFKWAQAQINLLNKYIDHYNERHLEEFVRVMNILDKQRKTNWKKTLPEVVEIYEKYLPHIKI